MKLALSLILVLVCAGILLRGYFSEIRPFGIVKEAARQCPAIVRRQPVVVLWLFLPVFLAPLGAVLAQGWATWWLPRLALGTAWQVACTVMLALAAVRLHRGIIYRDYTNRIRVGRRELRMAAFVVGAVLVIACVRFVPTVTQATLALPRVVLTVVDLSAFVLSWALVAWFAYVGPAASFDERRPFAVSATCLRTQPVGTVALVLLTQALLGLAGLAMTSTILLGQVSDIVVVLALFATATAMVAIFVISETAMAIGLTRIRENAYDDTRSRDHNADWH